MSFRVANLANLFWDNNSFKYPNTYPRLVNGVNVNKTPVMNSPNTGWVVLEGEWNYCEFKGELFFLKKERRISISKNKWMYILIKDHLCNLFKNKADVIAQGTLVTASIDKLKPKDFQFTFPAFNKFNKRILLPLVSEQYNWKKHCKPVKIQKKFEPYSPITNKEFSEFIAVLEANKTMLLQGGKKWDSEIKKNKHLVLLGKIGYGAKTVKGWKQELVEKINELLDDIERGTRDDLVLGRVTNDNIQGATRFNEKWAISYSSLNPLFVFADQNSREITLDLSGLTDIELINMDSLTSKERYTRDYFNLFLNWNENLLDPEYSNRLTTFVHKLSRRVRLPFFSPDSSRAVIQKNQKWYKWVWTYDLFQKDLFFPQKVFIESTKPLLPKEQYLRDYPSQRKTKSYRSVYLYWCFDLNFYFVWGPDMKSFSYTKYKTDDTWLDTEKYYTGGSKALLRQISSNTYLATGDSWDIDVIPHLATKDSYYWGGYWKYGSESYEFKEEYNSYYPWTTVKEPINMGWLLGQFSPFIEGQEGFFEADYPFVIKTGVQILGADRKLKRLWGLKPLVSKMLHLQDVYTNANTGQDMTLELFTRTPRKTIEKGLEEDFLIGEKMLFTTWGMAPYILFQPANLSVSSDQGGLRMIYGYYDWSATEGNYYAPYETFGKWLDYGSYHYVYSIFDGGSYFSQNAKSWYKKAYESFQSLTPYERFYANPTSFKKLKTHATKNTGAYFQTKEVDFKTNPIKELKIGDIFFSDLEWFLYDQGGTAKFGSVHPSEFFKHSKSPLKLQDGDMVAYISPKDNKIRLGAVSVWEDQMQLPEGQFITQGGATGISSTNYVKATYTKISPVTTTHVARAEVAFENIDTLLSTLKESNYFKSVQPSSLKEITDLQRSFLFNLKGTPFFCLLDRLGRVSLIFKNKEKYESQEFIPN